MKQSRVMSLVESFANVVAGYGVAVVTQILIFPVFGLHTTLAQNLKMGVVFTVVSVARSFALRRVFDRAPNPSHAGREERMASRYAGSHPAILRRDLMDRLSAAVRTRLRAKWRTVAMFRAPWPLRRRDWSSAKVTSRTQCRRFSIAQCSRTTVAASRGERAREETK